MNEHEYVEPTDVLKRVETYPDVWTEWGVWRETLDDEGGEG